MTVVEGFALSKISATLLKQNSSILFQGKYDGNPTSLMVSKPTLPRVAFSPGEFAALFGKSQTWGYRQIYSQKVAAITEHGRILIPAKEVERILGTAGAYNGMKPKVAKPGKKLEGWRQFILDQRKGKTEPAKPAAAPLLRRLPPAVVNARSDALARLPRGHGR